MCAIPGGNGMDPSVLARDLHTRRKTSFIQIRYVLVVLGFIGLLCVYVMRVNLNVAIVSMVNRTQMSQTTLPSDCYDTSFAINSSLPASTKSSDGPFLWSPATQGLVLSSFYWGYIVSPIPGGALAERFSAKWFFAFGVLITAVLSLLIPVVTFRFGHVGLIVIRVLQGLGEGVTYPALEVQLAHWIPSTERTAAVSYVHTGGFCGVVVGMLLAGELASGTFLGGWPSVFYVSGAASIIWFIVWILAVSDRPEQHPYISQAELDFIINDLGKNRNSKSPTPWKEILRSPAVWSVHMAFFGALYLQYILVTVLPTYLGTVLYFDIKSSGFYSSLPYIGAIISSVASGHICDALIARRWLSVTNARKLLNGIALVVPSIILFIVVNVAGCDGLLSLVLFVIAGSIRGMSEAGVGPIPIDMAPDFAGSVFGISVMIGAVSGILVPYITGLFTDRENTLTSWSYSFYLAGAIGLISALSFQLFATAEVQPWGTSPRSDQDREGSTGPRQLNTMNDVRKPEQKSPANLNMTMRECDHEMELRIS